MGRTKLVLLSLVAAAAATLAVVAPGSDSAAAKPCSRKKFETKLIGDACATGQDAAKTAMKTFLKTAKKMDKSLGCPTCHSKVGGNYPLKPDGLKRFKDDGGS